MKPQDFFLGIREFLSVLVPGLALLLIFPQIGQTLETQLELALPGEAGPTAFAFAALLAAYGLGTLAAAAASLLDGYVDDHLIGTDGGRPKRILRKGFGVTKASAELAKAKAYAEGLEAKVLPKPAAAPDSRPWSVKAFWWNYMRLNCPAAVEELDRIEGYQKLFRALGPLALLAAVAGHALGSLFILLCLAACWAFLSLYMRWRIRFARRLFELVVIASLPENALRDAGEAFFPRGGATTKGNSTMSANLDLIRAVYAAFAEADIPGVVACMAPDIVWNEAENFPYADGNPYCGPDAILAGVFARLGGEWDGFAAIPAEYLEAISSRDEAAGDSEIAAAQTPGDTILVLGRYGGTHRATGRALDAQFAHVWRVADGKAVRFQQYTDTLQAARVTGAA